MAQLDNLSIKFIAENAIEIDTEFMSFTVMKNQLESLANPQSFTFCSSIDDDDRFSRAFFKHNYEN